MRIKYVPYNLIMEIWSSWKIDSNTKLDYRNQFCNVSYKSADVSEF